MNVKTWALFASVSVASITVVGCGDSAGTGGAGGAATTGTTVTGSSTHATGTGTSTSGSTTTTAASGSTTASSSTGGATCAVPNDQNDTCDHACAAAFDCGALVCTAPDQLCTGFAPMGGLTKVQFTSSCVPQCMQVPAFKAVIDVTDCAGTIATIKGNSAAFAGICTP